MDGQSLWRFAKVGCKLNDGRDGGQPSAFGEATHHLDTLIPRTLHFLSVRVSGTLAIGLEIGVRLMPVNVAQHAAKTIKQQAKGLAKAIGEPLAATQERIAKAHGFSSWFHLRDVMGESPADARLQGAAISARSGPARRTKVATDIAAAAAHRFAVSSGLPSGADRLWLASLGFQSLGDIRPVFHLESMVTEAGSLPGRQINLWDKGSLTIFSGLDLDAWQPLGSLIAKRHLEAGGSSILVNELPDDAAFAEPVGTRILLPNGDVVNVLSHLVDALANDNAPIQPNSVFVLFNWRLELSVNGYGNSIKLISRLLDDGHAVVIFHHLSQTHYWPGAGTELPISYPPGTRIYIQPPSSQLSVSEDPNGSTQRIRLTEIENQPEGPSYTRPFTVEMEKKGIPFVSDVFLSRYGSAQ